MMEYIEKAKTLVEALPYIKNFSGNIVVIKYGGSALVDEKIKDSVMADIALLKFVGLKPVIVHGGGPEISKALKQMGKESKFINGCRVTDSETMEVVEMVLAGKLNKQIVTELNKQGIKAVGICGKDAGTIVAEKKVVDGVDLGLVGQVKHVDTTLLKTLIDNDFVPVIAPVGGDENGNSYNINADYSAVAVAGALKATKLMFLTDVAGVLTDVNDPKSLLSFVKVEKIHELIENKTISGGMIPKVECCVAGVNAGVDHVHIIDGRKEHCILLEIFTPEGIGTLVEK